jgi:hypothetical protein
VHIKKAISNLNPDQVRLALNRPLRIDIRAASRDRYREIENFLLGDLKEGRRRESALYLAQELTPVASPSDVTIYDEAIMAPPRSLIYRRDRPELLVRRALEKHPDLGVPLARSFPPFRRPFIQRVISRTCKENTLFSLTTALPDVIPNVIELPWAVAEFASDTAFLTMNQLKMAFLIAAASDREVGYREQKSEVATVIASAFGWRAIARQLVGKIPFGGGLIAKASIAYAGTKVVGLSLERLYSIGYAYTREDREELYREAFEQGRRAAGRIIRHLRPDLAAKYASAESAKRAEARRAAGYESGGAD